MNAFSDDKSVAIFIDNQAAIQVIKFFKQQSGQYMLRALINKITTSGRRSHLHWILAHEGVLGNEAVDIAANEAIEWRQQQEKSRGATQNLRASKRNDLRILTSTVKIEIPSRAKADWVEAWRIDITERAIYRLIKVLIKNVL